MQNNIYIIANVNISSALIALSEVQRFLLLSNCILVQGSRSLSLDYTKPEVLTLFED